MKAVAMDMSQAYITAVHENLPGVVIVFDHFHVIKLFNDKLSNLRRALHREATELLHKDVLKGTRWLLLKNPENLDPQRRERERLEEALRLSKPLATAYYMEEDLRRLWDQPDKAAAERLLDDSSLPAVTGTAFFDPAVVPYLAFGLAGANYLWPSCLWA